MRHNKKNNHLGRTTSHRSAMLSNMAVSLIIHRRIFTTLAKAKELRKYVEPIITKAKNDTTHSRRLVFQRLHNKYAVTELFQKVSLKVADRSGGYTRIIKTGNRLGDNASMCFIELVDYNEFMLKGTEAKKTTKRRRYRYGKNAVKETDISTAEKTTEEVEVTSPLMDYKQEMDYAVKNNIAQFGDIFDFDGVPNEKLYKDLYFFCRENLDIHSKRKSISHSSFLFSNNFSPNARARTDKNKNAIFINIGLIKDCIDKYLLNTNLNEFIKSKYTNLASKYDISIGHLAFQVNTQFTYYHELAHLFQYSKINAENELHERTSDGEYDIMKHKLEINADTHASIYIATHIQQYIEKTFGNNINQYNIVSTITIIGACLLDYILSFTDKFEIYFEKFSHPHSLIRILNVILNITNHLSHNPIYIEKGIKLNPISLFSKIIDFHKELEDNKIFLTGFSNSIQEYVKKRRDIISYFRKIRDIGDDSEYIDAMSIWNKHVKTIDI